MSRMDIIQVFYFIFNVLLPDIKIGRNSRNMRNLKDIWIRSNYTITFRFLFSVYGIIITKMPESFDCIQFRRIHEAQDDNGKEMNRNIVLMEKVNYSCGKLALLALIALLMERTYGIFNHYLDYPTYFETRYVSQFYAQMPALTICPLIGYNETILQVNSYNTK